MQILNFDLRKIISEQTLAKMAPRVAIFVALCLIVAIGALLAHYSNPCYKFLVSTEGIVTASVMGTMGIALMIFWPARKTQEKEEVPPPILEQPAVPSFPDDEAFESFDTDYGSNKFSTAQN